MKALSGAAAIAAASILTFASAAAPARAEAPNVVASITPVHALVSGVMGELGKPYLLLKGGTSPHSYALRPSDARALQSARLVFWIGQELERFLSKPLKVLGAKARKVRLIEAKGVKTLRLREGGVWADHGDAHGQDKARKPNKGQAHDREQGHGDEEHDAHIWLDPQNAKAMVSTIVAALAQADPDNAAAYRANAAALTGRLGALDRELEAKLAPVRASPFIVFHDAYQYLERRYRLRAAGSITLDPGRTPGARRLSEIREIIRARRAHCVFAEPQFRPGLVGTVIESTGARAATLDPLGARLKPGTEAYFTLMRRLADSLTGCLKAGS